MIMSLICPLLISGAINSNLAVLHTMGVNVSRFRTDVVERSTALGALEYHEVKQVAEYVEYELNMPHELSPIIAAQLLYESKHLTHKGERKVENDSGKTVSIAGYTQMSPSLRLKYKKMGKSVYKVEDSVFIMSHYMMYLAKQVWDQLSQEDKERITVKQLWVNALKRYNGTGYSSYRTIYRSLQNRGSSGSLENRDYIVTIIGGFHKLTPSEIRGETYKGKIRPWGEEEDTKHDTTFRFQRIEGIIQALRSADFCVDGTTLFLSTKVIDTELFR